MPAKSQAQAHLMGMIAAGKIKRPGLPAPGVAREFVTGEKVSDLPQRLHPVPSAPQSPWLQMSKKKF